MSHELERISVRAHCTCGWASAAHSSAVGAKLALARHAGRCAGDVLDLARAEPWSEAVPTYASVFAQKRKGRKGAQYWVYSQPDGDRCFIAPAVARLYIERDDYRLVDVNRTIGPA